MKTKLEEILSYYRFGNNGKPVLSWDEEECLEFWYPHNGKMRSFSINEVTEFLSNGFEFYNINEEEMTFIPKTNIYAVSLNEKFIMDRREGLMNTQNYNLEIEF